MTCSHLFKGLDPGYLVSKFGDNCHSRNRDMAQNMILLGCNLESSRSSVNSKVNKIFY